MKKWSYQFIGRATFVATLSLLLSAGARASEDSSGSLSTPLQLGLFWDAKIPWNIDNVRGLSLGIFNEKEELVGLDIGALNIGTKSEWVEHHRIGNTSYGQYAPVGSRSIKGIQLGFANIVGDEMDGIQLAFFGGNLVAGEMNGLQAGLVNAASHMNGIQAGLIASVAKEMRGIQASFLLNTTEKESSGIQVAAMNIAKGRVTGVQIGLGNRVDGETMHGVQIGILNVAQRLNGVQIGIFNRIMESPHPFMPIINWSF